MMPISVDRHCLDNGLTVLLAPSRLAPVVAVQAWVGVGSADETHRQAGIAHVFEHMLFKGTAKRGVGEIARSVEASGGEINAWTSFDQTVFHVVIASRYTNTALDVLADALINPTFDEQELEREREVILEEIRQSEDDPMRSVARALFATAFRKHPYRRPVIGRADVIRKLSRANLFSFLQNWYVGSNITLSVAGNFEPARVLRRIRRVFGALPAGDVTRRRRREPRQSEPRSLIVDRDIHDAHLAFAFHIPQLRSPEAPALDVAALILGQGGSSRLSTDVKRQRELVQSIYAYAHTLRDSGLFVVSSTLRPKDLDEATQVVAEAIYRLGHEEVSRAELDKATHAIEADVVYHKETVEGLARNYGFFAMTAGDPMFEKRYLEQINKVTPGDIRATCARYLRLDNTSVAALRNAGGRRQQRDEKKLLTGLRKAYRAVARRFSKAVVHLRGDDALTRYVLPNGARVVILSDRNVPLVAMRAVWTGGLRLETPATNGINYLTASTVTRGAGNYTGEQLVKLIDEMAGSMSGFSGRNSLGLRAEWLVRNWERGFDLVADTILAPRFDTDEFERERRRIIEELASREDSPTVTAFRAFTQTLYKKHPYRLDVLGTRKSVEGLTVQRVRNYYKRTFAVSNLTLAVVGDVDPARVIDLMTERFGDAPRRTPKKRQVPREQFFGRSKRARTTRRYLDRQQAHLVVGFPGTCLDDPDRHGIEVLMTILSGQSGRLFVELRDRQALAYRVGAQAMEGIDPGYIAVYISCSPEKLPAALAGIRGEVDRVLQDGVTREEVDRSIKYLLGSHDISLQRRSALASACAFHEAYGLGYDDFKRYPSRISAITADDVQRIAREYLRWDLSVTATVTPED